MKHITMILVATLTLAGLVYARNLTPMVTTTTAIVQNNCETLRARVKAIQDEIANIDRQLNDRNLSAAEKNQLRQQRAELVRILGPLQDELNKCTLPDLTVPYEQSAALCRLDGDYLLITVKNQGLSRASRFRVTVTFGNRGESFTDVDSLGANSSTQVRVKIIRSCFNADCYFSIKVDSLNQVQERLENNNSRSGHCIG